MKYKTTYRLLFSFIFLIVLFCWQMLLIANKNGGTAQNTTTQQDTNNKELTSILAKIDKLTATYFYNDLIIAYKELANYYAKQNNKPKELEAFVSMAFYEEKIGNLEGAKLLLVEVGKQQLDLKIFDKAIENHDKAVSIQEKVDEMEAYANLCYELGNTYEKHEKLDQALKFFEKCLDKYKQLKMTDKYVEVGLKSSNLFSILGLKPQALNLYNEILVITTENKDQLNTVLCLNGIGKIYSSLKEYDKTLGYLERAETICETNNLLEEHANTLNNIAAIYIDKNDLQKAAEIAMEATQILYKTENSESLINNYNLLGDIALQTQDFIQASVNYEESHNIAKSINNTPKIIENLNDKGFMFIQMSNYKDAIDACSQAYLLAKENNIAPLLYKSCDCLAQAYNNLNDTKNSYHYFQEFNTLERELFSTDKAKEIGKIEGKYEYKLIEKDTKFKIESLEKENQFQKIWAYILTFAAILLVLFTMFLYKQYKIKLQNHEALLELHQKLQKSNKTQEILNNELLKSNDKKEILNKQLEKTNNELAQLNKVYNQVNGLLQQSNEKLEQANDSLANFASVAAHDLKAPLRSISSFSNLLARKNKNIFDETDKEYFQFITENTNRLQKMIDSLLNFSKIDKNLPPPTTIKIEDIIANVEGNLSTLIHEKSALIQYKNLPSIKAHQSLIEQLFQNIIANSIKFSKPDTQPIITIKAQNNPNNKIHISITDNGIGVEPQNIDKAFELFARFNKQSEYEGSGIGLSTCKKIVNFYGGEIWLESTLGQGTTINFTLQA